MDQVNDQMFPLYVDNSRLMNSDLGRIIDQMAYETGPEAFASQKEALISRLDSRRPTLNLHHRIMRKKWRQVYRMPTL